MVDDLRAAVHLDRGYLLPGQRARFDEQYITHHPAAARVFLSFGVTRDAACLSRLYSKAGAFYGVWDSRDSRRAGHRVCVRESRAVASISRRTRDGVHCREYR